MKNNEQVKVLVIASVWPEPNSSAAGSRMLELLSCFLQQNWQVTFASTAAESIHASDLSSLGISEQVIRVNDASFDEFVTELEPQIVLFDRFMMEEQFGWRVEKFCPEALRLLDTEDLHCLRKERHLALKKGEPFDVRQLLTSEVAKREVASILRCDLSLMISSYEIDLLQKSLQVNESLLHHIPFMFEPLDENECQQQWPNFSEREGFVTIGNFRHEPNWDAVLYLKQQVWPLIRKQRPNLNLYIYGAYQPPKAAQLHKPKEGFHVLGWADDARAVMSQARICLAPLRFGAGIKGKLVEAMLCGTPSVTTSIGAEAMHADLPWNGIIANDPQEIADAAIKLYEDEQAWAQAQQNGIAIINSLYDKQTHEQSLIMRINDLRENLAEHRQQNFLGAILRHHSMKSTQYMSQWIESKNKLQALQSEG